MHSFGIGLIHVSRATVADSPYATHDTNPQLALSCVFVASQWKNNKRIMLPVLEVLGGVGGF